MSHEKTWNQSRPAGYFDSFLARENPIYPAKDSHSEILPYNQRDHAYNEDQYDMSHEKTWN